MNDRKISLVLMALPLVLLTAGGAHASSEGASQWTAFMLSWRVIDALALIVLLVYFLKKPITQFLGERTTQISQDLDEARETRAKAEALIADYKKKIAGMEHELAKMREELSKTAESESQKVIANAERMAAAMVESARVTADQEVRKAKLALKNEAVDLAVEMAEALIREKITEDDRKRIAEEYLVKVGGMK